MKKSAKLSLTLALMLGVTGGVQMMNTNTASAEISDNFRLRLEGVMSYYNDPGQMYYHKSYNSHNGWNNYTRLYLTYDVDKNTRAYARLHSGYDNYSDYHKYSGNYSSSDPSSTAKNRTYFDQSYITFKDRVSNTTYLVGKRGMTLNNSLVYNSTGNFTGVQIDIGNWYDPNNLKLFWGDTMAGNRIIGIQGAYTPIKNIQFIATEFGKTDSKKDKFGNKDVITALGVKTTYKKGWNLVGEWDHNHAHKPIEYKYKNNNAALKAWFVEAYTGPTNDFSNLPYNKVGTHAFSVRYQKLGAPYAVTNHNNTFYDDQEGIRLEYGMVIKKGVSVDLTYGRMKDRGFDRTNKKGDINHIVVASMNYKFR